jgi:VanZ family protein
MASHQPIPEHSNQGVPSRRDRLWRYAPLLAWMGVIFLASTGALSATNSGSVIKPLLRWLFPNITDTGVAITHTVVRKGGHFTEYAVLALLAARAFSRSGHEGLRRRWLAAALSLVVLYSFSDEFHQSFVASRTASIFDCMIDITGGLAALIFYRWRHLRAPRK